MIEQPSRRGFITGLIAFAATAPAIVRAGSLMPVKVMDPAPAILVATDEMLALLYRRMAQAERLIAEMMVKTLYGDRAFYVDADQPSTINYSPDMVRATEWEWKSWTATIPKASKTSAT